MQYDFSVAPFREEVARRTTTTLFNQSYFPDREGAPSFGCVSEKFTTEGDGVGVGVGEGLPAGETLGAVLGPTDGLARGDGDRETEGVTHCPGWSPAWRGLPSAPICPAFSRAC